MALVQVYQESDIATAVEELNHLREQVLYEDKDADPWEALSSSELEWIDAEIGKCCADFRYAAYNYFWLGHTKDSIPCLFNLWPAQELFLSIVENMWAEGEPAWIITHKARQLGISTVVEAILAWKNLFFSNQISMIIAQDPDQAEHLLKISLYIMDHMPWWMRPMEQSREFKEAMILENKDPYERSFKAGLNNWIIANGCTKISAFGQGKPIHIFHGSELSSWPSDRARKIISQDMKYAFAKKPGCLAAMESKPRGMVGYWYNMWHVFDGQGLSAEYFPFYVPAFFEKDRRLDPPPAWEPDEEAIAIRENYSLEWTQCDECGTPLPMRWGEIESCVKCGSPNHSPILLDDAQLYWYQEEKKTAAAQGKQELRDFYQEMSITPEQGFQASGIIVFPDEVMAYLQRTCHPGQKGYFDDAFNWHAERNCKICHDDHLGEDYPMEMWEPPQEGARYVAGVDVAEGEEEGDYSVIHVIKMGYGFKIPDKQVFEWYGHIDGHEFARVCYLVGKAYNEAMMAIDAIGPGYGTLGLLLHQFNYGNIYRWKHLDSFTKIQSNKAGLWTNYKTRRTMITWGIRWLRRQIWEIRSTHFLEEAPFFQKDDDDAKAEALEGHFDDCVPEGTLVTTSTGQKPIEEVRAGELVLTHKGRFMPVTHTGSRFEDKKLIEVMAYGRPPLLVTAEHKLWLSQKEFIYYEKGKTCEYQPKKKRWNRHTRGRQTKKVVYSDPNWVSWESSQLNLKGKYATCSVAATAEIETERVDLFKGLPESYRIVDGVLTAFAKGTMREIPTQHKMKRFVPVDKNFLRMIGYYLAEGARGLSSIAFASHRREFPIRNWLIGYIKSLGAHAGESKTSANGSEVWCSSIPLNYFFREFRKREGKRLPSWVTLLPPEKQKEVIVGYLLGDGCFRRESGAIQSATISPEAAFQIFNMAMRCGWACSLIGYSGQNGHKKQWKINFSSWTSKEIKSLIEPEILACKRPLSPLRRISTDVIKLVDGRMFGTIYSTKEIPFCGTVYNLNVEEDHSFVANGTVISNSIMAGLCANYAAHEDDRDPMTGRFNLPAGITRSREGGNYIATCVKGHKFDTDDPSQGGHARCPKCNSLIQGAEKKPQSGTLEAERLIAMVTGPKAEKGFNIPPFDQL